MLCSIVDIEGKEILKYLSNEELTDLIKCNDRDNDESNNNGVMSIYHGNFVEDKIYNHKIISKYDIALDNKKISINGISFNDYEKEVNENFDMNVNNIFDAYCVEDEFTRNIHINMLKTGEYIDIRIEN